MFSSVGIVALLVEVVPVWSALQQVCDTFVCKILRHCHYTGGLAHPSSCSSLDEKFPSLPQRLLSHSGSNSTRNTWSGEKLTASLDSLASYGDSPHSTSWAEEVEEMQPSQSFASLFNSSINSSSSSPTLPRTPGVYILPKN